MTGQASKVARGLRTIGNNIADTANKTGELSYSVEGTTKSISLLDEATGDMKSTYDVLGDIAQDWDKMSQSEQQAIAISLAGKNQFEVFGAVLSNFENAVNATNTALDSQGSAARENEAYLESLQAKVTALKNQFQEFVLGDGGITALAKGFLTFSTSILEFINDIGGLRTILITVTGLLIAFKGALILDKATQVLSFITNLASGIKGLTSIIPNAISAWSAYSAGIVSANTAIQASMPIIGALTIALGALSMGISEYNQSQEEARQEALNSIDSLNSYVDSIEESINTVNAETTSKEQLIDIISQLDDAYGIEKAQLQDINSLREEAIEKIYQESLAKAEQTKRETGKEYQEAEDFFNQGSVRLGGEGLLGSTSNLSYYQGDPLSVYEEIGNAIDKLNKKRESGKNLSAIESDMLKNLEDDYAELGDQIKENQQYIDGYEKAQDILINGVDDLDNLLASQGKKFNKNTGEIEDMTDAEKKAYSIVKKTADSFKGYFEESDKASESVKDLGIYSTESMTAMNEATKDQQDSLSALASDISNITSAYQTAVDALYEYNQQGYLSVDTYSQLMSIAPEYLAMMINENGQLYANANGVTTLYQAKVYEMGITAARAQVNLAASLAGEAGAYASLGNAAIDASGGIWELVKAEMAEQVAKVEDPRDLEALENRVNAINDLTQSTIANAKYTTASIQPTQASTSATKDNTGARNSNADATKAQTAALKAHKEALEAEQEALGSEIDDYETVIDYVKDLLKEEQEAVEEEKDAQLEAIQDKIDALEEEQEVFEENIEAQIDALEKQRDETEEYWDAQIDAINDANDALEENMRLQELQEALASAKSQKVKVLKGGRFVYTEDEEAISKAEQELADYEMELAVQRQIEELERLKEEALASLDKQLEELEDYRDKTNDNYEQQLEDLQNYYDKVEAEYDKRIQQYDDWLEQFEDMLEASSKRHAQILYNELVGEQGNWNARIKALSTFVKNYEAKKNQLDGIKSQIEAIDDQIKALESSSASSLSTMNNRLSNAKSLQNQISSIANSTIKKLRAYVLDKENNRVYATKRYNKFEDAWDDADAWMKKNKKMLGEGAGILVESEYYAKGTYSTPEDQIALVADPMRPSNRELVVGSKINQGNGILTSLKKGTGVIPAGQNLTENLINLANWSSNGGFERAFTTMNNSTSKVVHIENINLPNVENGEQLVEYLETNFVNDSIQYSNIRG